MKKFQVIAQALNLRKEPSLQGQVISILAKNSVVDWISTSGDGYWQKVSTIAGKVGWAANKYLAIAKDQVPDPAAFPWMRIARSELGTREVLGNGDNPRIVEYLNSTTLLAPLTAKDETAWCSAFVNWCLEKAGYAGTDSAWARSWLNWGRVIETPVPGCITILTREGGGHVGFFISRTSKTIKILGGNQSDCVCEMDYKADRLLGFRVAE
jgi:uncharacterized protein (TIGR02594 family)